MAAVVCVDEQADLEPDIYDLMSSAHLEDKQLFFLQVYLEIAFHTPYRVFESFRG